jgi:hypothetical protein
LSRAGLSLDQVPQFCATKWMNGWSTAATFEGEFRDVTRF